MPQIYDQTIIKEVEDMIIKLKETIDRIMKLRTACARCELELAIQNHSLCLEILQNMDQFIESHETATP